MLVPRAPALVASAPLPSILEGVPPLQRGGSASSSWSGRGDRLPERTSLGGSLSILGLVAAGGCALSSLGRRGNGIARRVVNYLPRYKSKNLSIAIGINGTTLVNSDQVRKQKEERARQSKTKIMEMIHSQLEIAEDEEMQEFKITSVDMEISPRLDRVLAGRISQSREYFSALIRRGAVKVNGSTRQKPSSKIQEGDSVAVWLLTDEKTLTVEPEDIPLWVIYEDKDVLVINKSVGLVVHPGPGHWTGTLVNAVLHHLGRTADAMPLPLDSKSADDMWRPGVVHRLDAGTSGVIVLAKTPLAFESLTTSFRERKVEKTYLAVCSGGRADYRDGGLATGGCLIDEPLGRDPVDRVKQAIVPEAEGGKPSKTFVRAIAELDFFRRDNTQSLPAGMKGISVNKKGAALSLLEVQLITGRTHQIRVHLDHKETPVLGDDMYGVCRQVQVPRMPDRPLLHAYRLSFPHPRTGEWVTFVARLPKDIRYYCRRMVPNPGKQEYLERLIRRDGRDGPPPEWQEQSTKEAKAAAAKEKETFVKWEGIAGLQAEFN
mmetsp:Transcript_91475/g.247223  ORF Transcript_91475/g.247223 Transcript_91475/m.247223 type:complete len:547 (-) Transcript_91475:74-1714(-)